MGKKITLFLAIVKRKCSMIAEKYREAASKVLRDEVSKTATTAEKLFEELSGGSDKITEANFCKKLKSLNLDIPPDHAQILCRCIESDGISLSHFLSFVQIFYKVIKDTALTDKSDVKESQTVRKIERKKILEVLEGPVTDEKFGLTRLRVKCLSDGSTGWATAKGNQGTLFLEKTDKPTEPKSGESNEAKKTTDKPSKNK